MKDPKESPTRQEPMQGIISFEEVQGKDMNKIYNCLSNRQKKVFDLLCTGKQSVTDITIALGYSDPRSYVRDLKEKGVEIRDEWIDAGDGVRFKRYWINETPLKSKVNNIHTVGEVMQSSFRDLFERDHYD